MKGWLCPSLRRSGSISAAGAGCNQHQRDLAALKFRQGFLRVSKGSRTRIKQRAFKGRKNQMTRGEQGRKECNAANEVAVLRRF